MKKNTEYISRINRVIDYIETHLDEELNLQTLAGVANFSPYHFHRIFHAMTGESLYRFIQRLRLEKAASQLCAGTDMTITRIALDCGFSSSAAFSRAFREYFNVSPSEWRSQDAYSGKSKNCKTDSNMDQPESNTGKASACENVYVPINNNTSYTRRNSNMRYKNVTVKDLPDMHVAYVRHTGPYMGDGELFSSLFNRLFTWAGARDLLNFPETRVLSVYHDNPEITDEDKLRTSVCITVPEDTNVNGEIGKMTIPGGRYAMARFELDVDQYAAAWDQVFKEWLPASGYQPDDRPAFELCHNDPHEHPEGKHIVDICIPVKPL